jgi:hypothetical protein
MSDETEDLQREAQSARERLFASLERLDRRAHRVADDAAEATRAGAWGLAAVVLFWAGTAFASRSLRRSRRPLGRMGGSSSHTLVLTRSALGATAMGLSYLATRACVYALQHAQRIRMPLAPHLGQLSAGATPALPAAASVEVTAGGTSHALIAQTNSFDGEDHA